MSLNFGLCHDANSAGCRQENGMARINLCLRPRAASIENDTVHVPLSGLPFGSGAMRNLQTRDKGSFACPLIVSSIDVEPERYRLGHRR